jgi:uncharacterized glyoxalase superfamily protein PhnB
MKLTGLTPNLIVGDVGRSLEFYRDVLGFSVQMHVPDAPPFVFAGLERDGVTVFLNDAATVKADLPGVASIEVGKSGVGMFVAVDGVKDLWEDLRGRAPVAMPLKDQWYGMREFAITDPDGYLLTFAERIATEVEVMRS